MQIKKCQRRRCWSWVRGHILVHFQRSSLCYALYLLLILLIGSLSLRFVLILHTGRPLIVFVCLFATPPRKMKEKEAAAKKAKAKKTDAEPTEEEEEADAHKVEAHLSSSEEEGE